MTAIIRIVFAVAALAVFFWLLIGKTPSPGEDVVIDPNDSRQMGTLMGLMGGRITDAAVAQYALRRFEEVHGRKATMRDAAVVVGMMRGRQCGIRKEMNHGLHG